MSKTDEKKRDEALKRMMNTPSEDNKDFVERIKKEKTNARHVK